LLIGPVPRDYPKVDELGQQAFIRIRQTKS